MGSSLQPRPPTLQPGDQAFLSPHEAFRRHTFQVTVFRVITELQEALFWAVCITNIDWRELQREIELKTAGARIICGAQGRTRAQRRLLRLGVVLLGL